MVSSLQPPGPGHHEEVGDDGEPDDEEADDAMVGDGEVGDGVTACEPVRLSATGAPHNTGDYNAGSRQSVSAGHWARRDVRRQ